MKTGMNRAPAGADMPLLEMKGITKYFSGVMALNHADIHVRANEVLGLVGSNGAGKSTLMKVLSGLYPDYEGDVFLSGEKIRLENPLQALRLGIAVIYQEFNLVNALTVAENIFLGAEPVRRVAGLPFMNWKGMRERARELLMNLNFSLDPDALVGDLGVADQQLVQIAKTMAGKPRILIMDEPTARLSRGERDNLFDIVRRFRDLGTAIIYISHFLDEVFMIASRVTVLRDGRVEGDLPVSELDHSRLVFLMLGRSVEAKKKRARGAGEVLLSVNRLSMGDKFRDISFDLKSKEILGITGLVGAGRTELARAIFGAEDRSGIFGDISLKGEKFAPKTPHDAVKRGVALAPEDRKQQGLVLCRPIADNIAMAVNGRLTFGFFLNHRRRNALVGEMVRRLEIRTADVDLDASTLSGGNQQKVVVAKWLATEAGVLMLDQPTAGIDVGTKDEIYNLLDDLASGGTGIIVISDDPEELARLADRVLIMRRGKIAKELREPLTSEGILKAITGEAAQ